MKLNKINHIRWGVILTYFSLVINIILSIIYTPIMLRILGQSEHGLFSTVSSTMSWLSLLGLGIGSSYIRYFAKYKVRKDEESLASLNGLFLIIFCLIGVVALLCGVVIANNLPFIFADGMTSSEYKLARKLALIVTVDMAIGFPASVFSAIIRANEKYVQSKLVALFQNVCTPLLTLPLLLMGYGSIGMIAATTIIDFIAYSFNVLYCLKKLHIRIKVYGFEPGIIKGIFSFSIIIAINSLIAQFATGLDKMLITRYVNTAAASIYAIGCSLYNYYSAFSSAVSSVFATRIHGITAKFENDKCQLKKLLTEQFVKLGRIQYLIQMLLLTGIIFFGRTFIHFWAEGGGQDYSNSYWVAILLCVSSTVPLIQNIGNEIQRAQNKHKFRTLFYAIMTVINVGLTIVLCMFWGEIGAAVGTAISTIIVDVIIMNIYYHKHLFIDMCVFWREIMKMSKGMLLPLGIGLIMSFLSIDTIFEMMLYIMVYTVVYCLSMWHWAMNKEEKELCLGWLVKKVSRK